MRNFFLIIIILAGSDLFSKYLVIEFIEHLKTTQGLNYFRILPIFNIRHVENLGVSFSFFYSNEYYMRWVIVFVTSILFFVIIAIIYKSKNKNNKYFLSIIAGGALGNIIDRAISGSVTDFLDFHWDTYHYPTFNLADSFIFIGALLYIINDFRITNKNKKKKNGIKNEV